MKGLTHASFFSGVGGLDRGLEAAGWETVSFSEIDPYASAVLAHHWPTVENLGDITRLGGLPAPAGGEADGLQLDGREPVDGLRGPEPVPEGGIGAGDTVGASGPDPWRTALLWSGGFPCQDLSVAGKRRGFGLHHSVRDERLGQPEGRRSGTAGQGDAERTGDGVGAVGVRGDHAGTDAGTRSGLAFAFLDLLAGELAAGRGPEFVLLENVPGLLSSHAGRDFGALLGALAELGFGVAYRIIDARFVGVPQRRRRVFILGLRSGRDDPDGHLAALRAAEVLSVGTGCLRHPVKGVKKGTKTAGGPRGGPAADRVGGSLRGPDQTPDTRGVREADGLGGRLDHRPGLEGPQEFSVTGVNGQELAQTLRGFGHGWQGQQNDTNSVFIKVSRPHAKDGEGERWAGDQEVSPTLNSFDMTDTHAITLVGALRANSGGWRPRAEESPDMTVGPEGEEDDLLPMGLDSNRYRCCGNGVVSPVAYWIGKRLAGLRDVEMEDR